MNIKPKEWDKHLAGNYALFNRNAIFCLGYVPITPGCWRIFLILIIAGSCSRVKWELQLFLPKLAKAPNQSSQSAYSYKTHLFSRYEPVHWIFCWAHHWPRLKLTVLPLLPLVFLATGLQYPIAMLWGDGMRAGTFKPQDYSKITCSELVAMNRHMCIHQEDKPHRRENNTKRHSHSNQSGWVFNRRRPWFRKRKEAFLQAKHISKYTRGTQEVWGGNRAVLLHKESWKALGEGGVRLHFLIVLFNIVEGRCFDSVI